MNHKQISRREFLKTGLGMAAGVVAASPLSLASCTRATPPPQGGTKAAVVSIVKVEQDKVESAVEEAIALLGGIETIAAGKERIMLKPNLVAESSHITTKPPVVRTLAKLMKAAGKEVLVGEGSASAQGFNSIDGEDYRTKNREILDAMQQHVFDQLGYTDLTTELDIPLLNLHSGEMVTVPLPGGFAFKELTVHHSLTEIDLLCSVPMMKTHTLAQVTLGMKNLFGLFPGTVYGSVRGHVHDTTADVEPSGTAAAIVDMVRANKLGLVVVDGLMAMEGNGPASGDLVKMNVIVAGTNPLATDMVSASLMGFQPQEIPTFTWAHKAGMVPTTLDEIEIRGERLEKAKRKFKRPQVYTWNDIRNVWGYKEL